MKIQKLLSVAILLILVMAASAETITQWARESSYNQRFDAATIETIKGKISGISTYKIPGDAVSGVQLMVDSKGEQIPVHLGPDWYIDNQGKQFEVGEKVTVKGSRIDFDGSPAILALAVAMNNHMLVLRSASGAPVWAGWQTTR